MNHTMKTLVFVAIAGLTVSIAAVAHIVSQPQPVEGYALVGQEFYPEFQDPNTAQSLRVIAFNADIAEIKTFEIMHRKKDGLWIIPPYDYPADAKDQLSKTAASIIGIERGALISRRSADHEKYHVIDPLDAKATQIKSIGQRITLTKDDESVLADFIIGSEHASRPGFFYVRNPQEKETYLAKFEIDLSTKFADWIQDDLLQLTGSDIRGVTIKRYSIDEATGRILESENNILARKSSTEPWQLEGLKETEAVAEEAVSSIVSQLGDLKIVGVRPKPPGINANLTIDQEVVKNQLTLDLLVRNLQSKGFFIVPDKQSKMKLYSNEGEVVAATEEGIVYDLYFGELFTGSEFDIEVEFTKDKEKEQAGKEIPADKKSQDDKADAADTPKTFKSRYLFVATKFDRKFLGDAPVKPQLPVKQKPKTKTEPKPKDKPKAEKPKTEKPEPKDKPKTEKPKPEKPVESKPATEKTKNKKEGEISFDETAADDKPKTSKGETAKDKPAAKPAVDKKEAKPTEKPESPEEIAFKAAMDKYNSDLLKYEADQAAYDEKVRVGLEKVDKLNKRLGQWYYVISAESYENLRLARKELVKPKEEKEAPKAGQPAGNPFKLPPGFPAPKK